MGTKLTEFKGKVVGGAVYAHKSAVPALGFSFVEKSEVASSIIEKGTHWNVIKFDQKDPNKLSLLLYEDFTKAEFPALLNSFQVDLANEKYQSRNHSKSNPPILHRKELLLDPSDPKKEEYKALTCSLEELGAFKDISKYGTKIPWEQNLKRLCIKVSKHKVSQVVDEDTEEDNQSVVRHRTAISRSSLSTPAKLLFTSGLASEDNSFLDYGCGKGDDVKFLNELGIDATGWDPYFKPDNKNLITSDIVNLAFVINVIESPSERIEVLQKAYDLAKKCLAVSVMLPSQNDTIAALPFADGQITSTRTFQKYYQQVEIEELLSTALKVNPIAAAPGVFFIFKDEEVEQDYLLKRQLGIIRDYDPNLSLVKINEKKEKTKEATRIANLLAKHTLAFARKPELEELPHYFQQQLESSGISFRKAFNAASSLFSENDLRHAVKVKKEQLLLFLSMYFFSGRPKYKSFNRSLQKDIRLHFGSMTAAQDQAKELLYSLGNEKFIYEDSHLATEEGLGDLRDGKFTFHTNNTNNLSLRLRGVLAIAERMAGKLDDVDVIRIHIETKKVTYLSLDNFKNSPLPRILKRSIVDFREHSVKTITHDEGGKVKTLYLKSKLMADNEANYEIQKKFDETLEANTAFDFSGEGPKFEEFAKELLDKKIIPPAYK